MLMCSDKARWSRSVFCLGVFVFDKKAHTIPGKSITEIIFYLSDRSDIAYFGAA